MQIKKSKKEVFLSRLTGYTVRRKGGLFVDTYQEKGGKVEVIRLHGYSLALI